jgi:hypothetical protein
VTPLPRVRLALLLCLVAPVGLGAYLTLGTTVDGANITARWRALPLNYYVTNRASSTVTAAEFQRTVVASFDTWAAVPSASFGASFGGFTNAEPVRDDGATVIGFQSHDELERTLGVTAITLDRTSGAIVEADVFINSAFDWSVAPAGAPGRFDLQSVVTHELGHLLGLGHSALGETALRPEGGRRVLGKRSVMFPVAFETGTILDRQLQDDDVAGVSDVYPRASWLAGSGSIAGHVTMAGTGVFGAHVVAVHTATGETVASFSLASSGRFVIDGLSPGLYVVRAEPLDDVDLGSFFADTSRVEVGFVAAFAPKLVAVPKGGAGESIEITVAKK